MNILVLFGDKEKLLDDLRVLQSVMRAATLMTKRPDKIIPVLDNKEDWETCLESVDDSFLPSHVFDVILGSGLASLASFCLLRSEDRLPLSIEDTIQALKNAPITDGRKITMFGKTVVFDSNEDFKSMIANVIEHKGTDARLQAIFTINDQLRLNGQYGFHMNMTKDNILDAAAIIFSLHLKNLSEEQMSLAGLLCSTLKSRQAYQSLLFLGLKLHELFDASPKHVCEPHLSVVKCIGDSHLMLDSFDQSTHFYNKALFLAEQLLDRGLHINGVKAKIHNNIGLCLKHKGLLEEAITSFTNSLVAHMLYDDKTIDTALTINNLASCHYELQRFDQALDLFNRSLEIYTNLDATAMIARKIARVHNNIGLCLMENASFKEALANFEKFLRMYPDKDQLLLAKVNDSIGYCHSRLGQVQKALVAYKKAHQLRLEHYGSTLYDADDVINQSELLCRSQTSNAKLQEDLAIGLNNIGNCFLRCGEHTKALENFDSALEMRKRIYGDKHLQVATTLYSIGLVFKAMGILYMPEAHDHFERALEMAQQVEGGKGLASKVEQAMQKPTVRRNSIAKIVEQAMQKSIMRRQSLANIGEQNVED